MAELLGRVRMRGGPGAHRLRDAVEMVAELVYRRARALGMSRMDQPPRRPEPAVLVPPDPIAAESAERAREQMELEARRRAAGLARAEPPLLNRAAMTSQERLEYKARTRGLVKNLDADAERYAAAGQTVGDES